MQSDIKPSGSFRIRFSPWPSRWPPGSHGIPKWKGMFLNHATIESRCANRKHTYLYIWYLWKVGQLYVSSIDMYILTIVDTILATLTEHQFVYAQSVLIWNKCVYVITCIFCIYKTTRTRKYYTYYTNKQRHISNRLADFVVAVRIFRMVPISPFLNRLESRIEIGFWHEADQSSSYILPYHKYQSQNHGETLLF